MLQSRASFSGHFGLRFYRVQCIIMIVQVENILSAINVIPK